MSNHRMNAAPSLPPWAGIARNGVSTMDRSEARDSAERSVPSSSRAPASDDPTSERSDVCRWRRAPTRPSGHWASPAWPAGPRSRLPSHPAGPAPGQTDPRQRSPALQSVRAVARRRPGLAGGRRRVACASTSLPDRGHPKSLGDAEDGLPVSEVRTRGTC